MLSFTSLNEDRYITDPLTGLDVKTPDYDPITMKAIDPNEGGVGNFLTKLVTGKPLSPKVGNDVQPPKPEENTSFDPDLPGLYM